MTEMHHNHLKLENYFLLHVLIYKLEIAYNGLRIKKRIKNKHFCQLKEQKNEETRM